jgi:hypothetical protein
MSARFRPLGGHLAARAARRARSRPAADALFGGAAARNQAFSQYLLLTMIKLFFDGPFFPPDPYELDVDDSIE